MYSNYLKYLTSLKSRDEPFRRNGQYRKILEHVTNGQANDQLRLLRDEQSMSDDAILEQCHQLDSFGQPVLEKIGSLKDPISPTGLRQLYHAHRILAISDQTEFVEVGCGQGGLFLALHYLQPERIQKYHMVDLPEVVSLLRLTVGHYSQIEFHHADTFGANVPDGCFFISNQCQSEIDQKLRQSQKEKLVARCKHGFLAWNFIRFEDIGHPAQTMPEKPMTARGNLFVIF